MYNYPTALCIEKLRFSDWVNKHLNTLFFMVGFLDMCITISIISRHHTGMTLVMKEAKKMTNT